MSKEGSGEEMAVAEQIFFFLIIRALGLWELWIDMKITYHLHSDRAFSLLSQTQ